LLGSLSAKAFEVARLRRGAEGLKGAQRFAHEIKLKKSMEDLAEAVSTKELRNSAVDGAAGWQANKMSNEDGAENVRRL
jgi:hypothetical protein